jgi:hypothetical protein
MEKTGWKVIAIIFIILFILETSFLIFAFNLGTSIIENESECSINVCEDYLSYYYDTYTNMCYCYENHEVVKEQYIK